MGPQGFSTLNFDTIVFDIVEGQPNGYVPDFFEKPPSVHRKGINQEPKKGILVLVIVYMRFIVYLVIYYLYISLLGVG